MKLFIQYISTKYTIGFLLVFSSLHFYPQCNNGTNFFPTTIQNPIFNQWWSATANNWAGEIIRIGVSIGENFQFSTCVSFGNVQASYDTELTLTDINGNILDFNDDYLGCGTSSYINWTATFNGEVYLHINEQNCLSNSIPTEVMIFKSPPSNCTPPTFSFNKICQSNNIYDVALNISSLGSASAVNILNFDSTYFFNILSGNYSVTGLSGISKIKVVDINDSTCFREQYFSICNPCSFVSAPSDLPCNAPELNLNSTFYGSTNCGYSVSGGGLTNGPDNFCANSNNDSWLVFTAANDTVELDWNIIYDPVNGCDDGVQFAVLDGNCINEDNMVQLACYDPGGIFQSSGTFSIPSNNTSALPLIVGQQYFIYIDGYSGDFCDYYWIPKSGVATISTNDSCENALLVQCGDVDTSNNILVNNLNTPPSCSALVPGDGMWYKFIGDGSRLTVSTSNSFTNFDTQIHIYQGNCNNLTSLGCDDNSGIGNTSEISFLTSQNIEYYIFVSGNTGSSGQYIVSFNCEYCEFEFSTLITSETCDGENDGEIIINILGTGLYNLDTNGTLLYDSISPNIYTINNLKDGTYFISLENIYIPNCDTTISISINSGNNTYNLYLDTLICFGSSVIINNTIYNSSNNTGIENLTTIHGCDSTINIIVTEKTEIIFQIDTSICENDSIYFNNSLLHFDNSTGEQIFQAANGCDSTVIMALDFFPLPNISSNISDTTICEDDTIILYGIGANSYTWNNNILDSVSIIAPIEGHYIVTGIDSNHCQNSYQFFIDTEFCPSDPFSIYIPNLVTSNQDGNNDVFMISGSSYEFISMKIFNRWGQLIFYDHLGRGWDGRLPSGLKAANGSYFYSIEVQPVTNPISIPVTYNGVLLLFSD